MKHIKLGVVILVLVTAISVLSSYLLLNPGKEPDRTSKDTSQATFTTFENKKYGYRVQHRPTALVFIKEEEERVPPEESESVYIGDVEVSTGIILASELGLSGANAGFVKTLKGDLGSFAVSAQEYRKNDTNPYMDRVVGELQKVTFASTTAYRFTMNETISNYAMQDAINKKIPRIKSSKKWVFIFLANQKNEKFLIKYDTNMKDAQDAERIVNSFEFTK